LRLPRTWVRGERLAVDPVETTTQAAPLLIAGFPAWIVLLVGGMAVVLVCWLFARAFRVLAVLLALGVLAGASWVAWQHVFG